MRALPLLTALFLATAGLAGCGSSTESSNADEAPASTPAATPATASSSTSPPTSTSSTPVPAPPTRPANTDISTAENAVRDALPDTPYWKGYRFRGVIKNARLICVDRIPPADDPISTGSFVMVSWPSFRIGEPKDGPCAKSAETADREIIAARNFYLKTDDDAIALEAAVMELQNGRSGAVPEIERIAQRLRLRVSNYPDTSYGGNLLVSSAVTAAEEGRKTEPSQRRLVSVRLDINEARASLAKDLAD